MVRAAMIRVAAAFLVLRFAASDDDDGARFAFGSKAPAAGDYAKVACGSGCFRAARLKPAQVTAAYEICAELDELWHASHVAADAICGGTCGATVASTEPHFAAFKISELRYDVDIYGAEARLAAAARESDGLRARLAVLGATARAALAYEDAGDGQALAAVLDGLGADGLRDFMKDSKGPRLTRLFERAQSLKVPVQDLLKREGYAPPKKKRRRKERKERKKRKELR